MYLDEYPFMMMLGSAFWFYITILVIFVVLLTFGQDKVPKIRICYFGGVTFVCSLLVPLVGFGFTMISTINGGRPGSSGLGDIISMISTVASPILLGISLLLLIISLKPNWESKRQRVAASPVPKKEPVDPFQ